MKNKLNREWLTALLSLECAILFALPASRAETNETNSVTSAVNSAGTNQTQTALEAAEAAEISRLQVLAQTNQLARSQWASLMKQRQARFLEELRQSSDPVSVAVKMALDPHVGQGEGIAELAKHWDDPRSEQTLEAISRRGRHFVGDLGRTLEGAAYDRLLEGRAKKQLLQIVDGKQTEQERDTAIIQFLESRPDLVKPYPSPLEKTVLARILFQELIKSDDTNAVRLVLKSGQFRREYATNHYSAMLVYARELTAEQAFGNSPLVEALGRSGDKAVIPIFENWLPEAKDIRTKQYLESKLKSLREKP
jgi:hypothetical protein